MTVRPETADRSIRVSFLGLFEQVSSIGLFKLEMTSFKTTQHHKSLWKPIEREHRS